MGNYSSTASDGVKPTAPKIVTCQICSSDINFLPSSASVTNSNSSSSSSSTSITPPASSSSSSHPSSQFIKCRFDHHLCRDCLTNMINITWMNKPFEIGSLPAEVCCPAEKCGIVFREHQIANVVDEATFQAFLDRRISAREGLVLVKMRQQLANMSESELDKQAELDREILAKQLRAQLFVGDGAEEGKTGTILQCPRCKFGPIEAMACWDLSAHHGQKVSQGGKINNSCPQCNFFERDKNKWHKWDGTLTDPRAIAKNIEMTKQLEEDHALKSTGCFAIVLFGILIMKSPYDLFVAFAFAAVISWIVHSILHYLFPVDAESSKKFQKLKAA